MRLRELENKIGAQYQSVAAVLPASIERVALAPNEALEKLAPDARDISRALALVSGARLATRLLAGFRPRMRRAMFTLLRPRHGRLRTFLLDDAVGTVPVTAFLLAGVDRVIAKKVSAGRLGRGLLMSSFAFLLDQTILTRRQERLFGARRRHRLLSAMTSGAIGAAYALTTPRKAGEPKDYSGGDIAAGVPATSAL